MKRPAPHSVAAKAKAKKAKKCGFGAAGGADGSEGGTHVVALAISRGREVGIAAIDSGSVTTIELAVVNDNQMYSGALAYIDAVRPKVILVPKHVSGSVLGKRIQELSWHTDELTVCSRDNFSEAGGVEILARIATSPTAASKAEAHPVVMMALKCVVVYVEFSLEIRFQQHAIQVRWETADATVVIDQVSIKHLEVIRNLRTGSSSGCGSLFGSLNHTETRVGARLLRRTLLSPPNDAVTIATRGDAVEALLNSESTMRGVRKQLSKLSVDLDFLLRQFAVVPKKIDALKARQSVQQVIKAKHLLELLPQIALEIGIEQANPLLRSIHDMLSLPVFATMASKIGEVVTGETMYSRRAAEARVQECFAVRAGISGALDVGRHDYIACMETIYAIEDEIGKRCNGTKLHHTAKRGFHLTTPRAEGGAGEHALPPEAIQAIAKGNKLLWSIPQLEALNRRHSDILQNVYHLTYETVRGLIDELRPLGIRELYGVTHSCALLDMLLSFATHVAKHSTEDAPWVRPSFNERGPFCLVGGRHPVVEHALSRQRDRRPPPGAVPVDAACFVPSNVYADRSAALTIVTGHNCAGKSTLLRSIALHTILAHAGSFVPALRLEVRLTDRIFTRIGTQDDMSANSSTFFVEMRETAFILSSISERSLVIIDELGRGTCNADGAAIAWSVCEHLLNTNALTFFVTHFHDLTALQSMYSRVANCHMANGFELKVGPAADTDGYGITLAEQCGLPAEIIDDARRIASKLKATRFRSRASDSATLTDVAGAPSNVRLASDRSQYVGVLHKLQALKNATIDENAMRGYLHSVRIGASGRHSHSPYLDALAKRAARRRSERALTMAPTISPPLHSASADGADIVVAPPSQRKDGGSNEDKSGSAVEHDAIDIAAATAIVLLSACTSGRQLNLQP